MSDTITIPARRGKAAYVAANQVVRVINTHGEQVVDTVGTIGNCMDELHVHWQSEPEGRSAVAALHEGHPAT